MNDTELHQRLRSSYADVVLPDPLTQVMARGSRVRRARRRMTTAAVAAVAAVAVVSATVTTAGGSDTSTAVVVAQGVRLATFTTPPSPVSLQTLPAGLTPTVDVDNGTVTVLYLDRDATSGAAVYLRGTSVTPASEVGAQTVAVAGTSGQLLTGVQDGNVPRATLTWERQPRQWVTLTGIGQYGTPEALLTLAPTVANDPVGLTTRVTLAPEGWVLSSYKDIGTAGGVLTLTDPISAERSLVLTVSDQPAAPVDPASLNDPGPLSTVQVQGRDATLVQGGTTWYLSAPLGQGSLVLQAPADLTAQQVLQIADTAALP